MRVLFILLMVYLLAGCASSRQEALDPLVATRYLMADTSETAGNTEFIRQLYDSRSWAPYSALGEDPLELGKEASIPIQQEGVKLLGPSQDDALRSLALKIWMIENAEHTIDVVYYIFKTDIVGQAMLGALCNAVQRGVDVRIMVDSIGSMSPFHTELMALETCAENAGYMRDISGDATPYQARVQVAIINAITSSPLWANRRSHDKLMVKDGAFPSKAAVITGGRNISLSYYGINADGSENLNTYRDLEILLRPGSQDTFAEFTVGNTSEIYFSLLFLHKGNKRLLPLYHEHPEDYPFLSADPYAEERLGLQQSLSKLKGFPEIQRRLRTMSDYMNSGFINSEVRLAHELGNLSNRNVVTNTEQNLEGNPNSIMGLLSEMGDELGDDERLRVVSPYMFMARYYDKDGNLVMDGVADTHAWLKQDPGNKVALITNSVLTSDNFLAQSIIDMDVGPRLLLSPELERAWLSGLEKGELNPQVTQSEEWKRQANNPQIYIFQTGRLDASVLGNGTAEYGKLHAKFIVGDDVGFVGTANFDYRSRLFNNEMGFFYSSEAVHRQLKDIFRDLRETSYRWGSPEWLQMRREVMELSGIKAWSTRQQRFIFKLLRGTGLEWLI